MLSLLVTLFVFLILAGLAYWALMKAAGLFGLPAQIVGILQIVLVVIFVIVLLTMVFGGGGGLPKVNLGG